MIFLERTDLYLYGFIYLYGLASEFCCRVTWFKFIGSLQISVYKLFLKKKRHADKSASTQLIIVCESPSSCNLKCEIGYIIPVSSGVNQTLLKTVFWALQRASSLSAVRREFWEAFFSSATFHYTKKCEILARFAQCPGRLVPLLLSHQSQPKIHQQGALLPWITAESSGITVPKVGTRKLLGAVVAGSGMSGINHIVFPHFSRMKHGARRNWRWF